MEVANTLNTFFSNNDHYLPHSLSRHPTLSAILKYKDHPSIRVIKKVSQRFQVSYFSPVDKNTVFKEIRKSKSKKPVQDTDVTVKIMKDNEEFFAEYIYLQYNQAKDHQIFLIVLSFQTYQLDLNKVQEIKRITTEVKQHTTSNLKNIWKAYVQTTLELLWTIFSRNFNMVLGKVTVHNIVSF